MYVNSFLVCTCDCFVIHRVYAELIMYACVSIMISFVTL